MIDCYLSLIAAPSFLLILPNKKNRARISCDISATRLSSGDPLGFPSHPRGWFGIIVYHHSFLEICINLYCHVPISQNNFFQ